MGVNGISLHHHVLDRVADGTNATSYLCSVKLNEGFRRAEIPKDERAFQCPILVRRHAPHRLKQLAGELALLSREPTGKRRFRTSSPSGWPKCVHLLPKFDEKLPSPCYRTLSRIMADYFIHLAKYLALERAGASDDPWKIVAADAERKLKRQLACKPGSVRPGSPKTARRGDHSSWMDVAVHLTQPTRMTGLETAPRVSPRAIPIRSCSRWGLPCRFCYQSRGGLLPHPFTLTRHAGRYSLCGTFPGVAPAGR